MPIKDHSLLPHTVYIYFQNSYFAEILRSCAGVSRAEGECVQIRQIVASYLFCRRKLIFPRGAAGGRPRQYHLSLEGGMQGA